MLEDEKPICIDNYITLCDRKAIKFQNVSDLTFDEIKEVMREAYDRGYKVISYNHTRRAKCS